MKRATLLASLISLLASSAVLAGDGKSCSHPVQACLNEMVQKLKSTGFIGVELDDSKQKGALIVTQVVPDSPAEKAGIRAGDDLYALNGIRFADGDHTALSQVKVPGKLVTVTVKRDGKSKDMQLTLVPMPADVMAKYIGEHMMGHAKPSKGEVAAK